MEDDDEIVTVRPLPGQDLTEIRISCPDATGLGCDIARVLLDFGLKEIQGDISTDGKWCFFIIQVGLVAGMRPRWEMLKKRLLTILPSLDQHINKFYMWKEELQLHLEQKQFVLQVTSYDRMGYLHDLVNALFECDLACAKAHITTSPSNGVLDVFWICDYTKELPSEARKDEIISTLKKTLGQPDANISITVATPESNDDPNAKSVSVQRRACMDSLPSTPLWMTCARSKDRLGGGTPDILLSQTSLESERHSLPLPNDGVKVTIDNCTSMTHTVLQICCRDRKGLLYDIMRTIKDNSLRVTYAKVAVKPNNTCFADVFVQEAVHKARITDAYILHWLVEKIRTAVRSPFTVSTKDVYDKIYTELKVVAPVDSGGRGRPKVTYDVTHGLSTMRVCVFMAEIQIEKVLNQYQEEELQESHRFLLQDRHGHALSEEARAQVEHIVKAALVGSAVPPPVPETAPPAAVQPISASASSLTESFGSGLPVSSSRDLSLNGKQHLPPHHIPMKASAAVAAGIGSAGLAPNLSGWNRKW